MAGLGLGRSERSIAVGALAHVQGRVLEIDVGPAQSAQLRGAQAGKDRRQQEWPVAAIEGAQDRANLAGAWDVHANLERALVPAIAVLRPLAPRMDDVLRHEAALHGVAEDAAEIDQHAADHGWGAAFRAQPILERAHQRHGQVGEPDGAEEWYDVIVEVLPVRLHGGALQAALRSVLQPELAGHGDRHPRVAMHPLRDIDADGGLVGLGVTLVRERLDALLAGLVGVVADPGFPDLVTLRCAPDALSD